MIFKLSNPKVVFQDKIGKWYFWNETWSDATGPYNTEEECNIALDEYCREVLGYENDLLNYSEEEERRNGNGC